MIITEVDARALIARMSDIERRQFPYAFVNALNDTAFEVRSAWRDEMPKIFDRPTRWTLESVLYRKATKTNPVAEIFLRSEIGDAIPPAQYLQFQVRGGQRAAKRSEKLLRTKGILGPNEYWVLGKGAKTDGFGNLPGRVVTSILSDVQAQFDPLQNSTPKSRQRRSRRKKVRGGVYFYNRAKRGRLPRGIYERIGTAFGSAVRSVMFIVNAAQYKKRYDVFRIAQGIFNRRFPENFKAWMAKAVATAK